MKPVTCLLFFITDKNLYAAVDEKGDNDDDNSYDNYCWWWISLFAPRNEMILLYDLKQAAGNCEFEIQSLK